MASNFVLNTELSLIVIKVVTCGFLHPNTIHGILIVQVISSFVHSSNIKIECEKWSTKTKLNDSSVLSYNWALMCSL